MAMQDEFHAFYFASSCMSCIIQQEVLWWFVFTDVLCHEGCEVCHLLNFICISYIYMSSERVYLYMHMCMVKSN